MKKYFYKNVLLIAVSTLNVTLLNAQTEYLVTVNPANAAISKIDSIPGVVRLKAYNIPAYGQNDRQYTFMGREEPNDSPFYLFTIDAIMGHTISRPLIVDHDNYQCLQYATTSNTLYGVIRNPASQVNSLITVNTTPATYSTVKTLPAFSAVTKLLVDNTHNYFYILGGDIVGHRTLAAIDMISGNTISNVNIPPVVNLVYNHLTNKIYGILIGNYRPPHPRTCTLVSVDPVSGTINSIADIPGLALPAPPGDETIDENNGRYFLTGYEMYDTATYLYTIDITDGHIINKVGIPASNVINKDNLINFRYDNNSNKLYALFWEAHTTKPPPTPVDSLCRFAGLTKVYINPSAHSLVVKKDPTICKVSLNVYNAIGQLILKGKIVNDGHNEFQLSNRSAGIYFYELISNGKVLSGGKVLKQ